VIENASGNEPPAGTLKTAAALLSAKIRESGKHNSRARLRRHRIKEEKTCAGRRPTGAYR